METNEVHKVQGEVEVAVQNAATRYGVRVGGVWYNGWGEVPVSKGAVVEIKYSVNSGYTDIEALRVLEGDVIERFDDDDDVPAAKWCGAQRDARITKAVALKCACVLLQHGRKKELEAVLNAAGEFERWLRATPHGSEAVR